MHKTPLLSSHCFHTRMFWMLFMKVASSAHEMSESTPDQRNPYSQLISHVCKRDQAPARERERNQKPSARRVWIKTDRYDFCASGSMAACLYWTLNLDSQQINSIWGLGKSKKRALYSAGLRCSINRRHVGILHWHLLLLRFVATINFLSIFWI